MSYHAAGNLNKTWNAITNEINDMELDLAGLHINLAKVIERSALRFDKRARFYLVGEINAGNVLNAPHNLP